MSCSLVLVAKSNKARQRLCAPQNLPFPNMVISVSILVTCHQTPLLPSMHGDVHFSLLHTVWLLACVHPLETHYLPQPIFSGPLNAPESGRPTHKTFISPLFPLSQQKPRHSSPPDCLFQPRASSSAPCVVISSHRNVLNSLCLMSIRV